MTSRILLRRGTAAQWASANPILGSGELGVETDTLKFKIGNGTSTWTQLTSYANITPSDLTSAINGLINAAPSALDTLNELAAAINNDSSFSTTVNNLLNGKISKSGGDTITASTASTVGLIIQGATSQTANLQQWQDSTGSVLSRVQADGTFVWGSASSALQNSSGRLIINLGSAASVGITVKGAASQTANLQEWQDSAGTMLANVDYRGYIYSSPGFLGGGSTQLYTNNGSWLIVSPGPTKNGLLIRGAASQTADLQQWQNSAGTVLARVYSNGNAKLGFGMGEFNVVTDLGASSWFGVYNSSTTKYYGISAQLPSPAGTSTLGGYYTGLGIGGSSHNTNSPIFAITTSTNATPTTAPVVTYDTGETKLRAQSAGYTPLKVIGAASQTANLQEWQDSSGTVLAKVQSNGVIDTSQYLNMSTSGNAGIAVGGSYRIRMTGGNTRVQSSSGIITTLTVEGAPSQTANLQEWQDSAGNIQAKITKDGVIVSGTSSSPASGIQTGSASFAGVAWNGISNPAGTTTLPSLVVKGITSQTANLQEWQNSGGTALSYIDKDGKATLTGGYISELYTGGGITGGTLGYLNASTFSASISPIVVRGAASQTANLQEWQNSSGTVSAFVDASGRGRFLSAILGSAGSSFGANFNLQASAAVIGAIIRGAASQTADLQQWQNSSGTVLVKVDSAGQITSTGNDHYFSSSTAYRPNIHIRNTTADSNGSYILFEKSRAGTAVVSGDVLGVLNFTGFDTSTYVGSAIVYGVAEGTFSTTSRPGKIVFATVSNGTTSMVDRMTIANSGTVTINGFNAASQGLIVKGAASQTANLFEAQNDSGTTLFVINGGSYSGTGSASVGNVGIAAISFNSQLYVQNNNASRTGQTIKGAASQTANLQEWQDSAGTILASVDAYGTLLSNWKAYIQSGASYLTPMTIVGASGQTANLQEWKNSAGTVNAFVTVGGFLGTNSDIRGLTGGIFGGISKLSSAGLTVYATAAGNPGAIIRGAASQTANLQEWQDSAGAVLVKVDQNGNIFTLNNLYVRNGGNDYGAAVNFGTGFNATKGFVLRGVASQTANLMEWQNSAATILTSVDASGNITAPSYNLSDSKYLLRKTIKKTVNPAGNAVANNTYDLFDMNFPSSLQGTFYIQASIRGPGYGQNLTYSLPATYAMDWINSYAITNPFTNNTTWVDLTPLTFSPRHLMIFDYFKFQAKVSNNQISFRIKLTGTLTGSPLFDIYIQHSEEFANSTITELDTTGTDATTSNVMPNFLSSKAGLSAIFNPITLYSNSVSNIPLTVKGSTSQNSDLQQWQNSSGTTLARVTSSGYIYSNAYAFDDATVLRSSSGKKMQFGSYWGIELIGSRQTSSWPTVVTGTSTDAGVSVLNSTASVVGLVVKGAASQTADLQQWQNSAGTALAFVESSGKLRSDELQGITNRIAIYQPIILPPSSTNIALIVKGQASQTANLQEWQDSSGNVQAKITAFGDIYTLGGRIFRGSQDLGGNVNILISSSTQKGIVVQGAASQTADLTQWRNSAGTVLAYIDKDGQILTPRVNLPANGLIVEGGTGPYIQMGTSATYLYTRSASNKGLIVQGAASQTADLQQWQNSSGAVLAEITSSGSLELNGKDIELMNIMGAF